MSTAVLVAMGGVIIKRDGCGEKEANSEQRGSPFTQWSHAYPKYSPLWKLKHATQG